MRSSTSLGLLALALATAAAVACSDGGLAYHEEETGPSADAGAEAATSALPLCVDGKPTSAYPPGPYEIGSGETVPPDLAFDGPDGKVAIASYYDPCAPQAHLLVVRSSAAWCGPCLWQAAHTRRFLDDPRFAGRLALVDLLVADEDNVPATLGALPRWAAKIDAPSKVAVDPSYTFGRALLARAPLPVYVLIDTRTMKIAGSLSDPDPVSLVGRIELELALLDKLPRPAPVTAPLYDEHFTENQLDLIRDMKLGNLALPADPTNEYADVPAAVALGKALFADTGLSPSGNVSCAKCHDLGQNLSDGVPQSTGVAKVDRNSPAIALAAHSRWQFWDGRADTLWMQALGPFEDAKEFGGSRLFVAKQIAQRYATQYAAVFGAKYPLPDLGALPAAGKPGDSAYDALSASDKDAVTRVFVNVGKAIAAYERAFRVKPNALDRYADGDTAALTLMQKHALSRYFTAGCIQCHWGPRLTDDAFHVLRFPTGRQDGTADVGREQGLVKLAAAEFRASTKWSDAPSAAKPFALEEPSALGAFKTPTLRGLPTSAPYGHGGMLPTLLEVARHYGKRGLEHADPHAIGTTEQWVPTFDAMGANELPALLEVLTGEVELP